MIIDKSFSHISPNAPTIVCEENKMKYTAHNINLAVVYRYRIDGDVITDREYKRCDYLVENETAKGAYFVELKGVNIKDAFAQIESTIRFFSDRLVGYNIHSRIVCSRITTHSVNNSEYRSLKKLCNDVIYRTKSYDENI